MVLAPSSILQSALLGFLLMAFTGVLEDCGHDALELRYWYERDRLLTRMKFLPDGSERPEAGKQLWDLANKVADPYATVRPQPLAAKWAIDEDGPAAACPLYGRVRLVLPITRLGRKALGGLT
jgi:hypothetical protein